MTPRRRMARFFHSWRMAMHSGGGGGARHPRVAYTTVAAARWMISCRPSLSTSTYQYAFITKSFILLIAATATLTTSSVGDLSLISRVYAKGFQLLSRFPFSAIYRKVILNIASLKVVLMVCIICMVISYPHQSILRTYYNPWWWFDAPTTNQSVNDVEQRHFLKPMIRVSYAFFSVLQGSQVACLSSYSWTSEPFPSIGSPVVVYHTIVVLLFHEYLLYQYRIQ